MCGIAGLLKNGYKKNEWERLLNIMSERLAHRGPDDEGIWYDEKAGVGLGHRRLSIIDLSPNGHQPMVSKSGRYVISYNGEIYNYLSEKAALERSGISFRGRSDTETLLESIEARGLEETLAQANGMFALALWDAKERVLSLARDRMGEKPLYYGFAGNAFAFASELKAIRALPGFRNEINRDVITLLLRHSCIPAPYSIYRGIHKLLPGTYLSVTAANLASGSLPEPVPYWSLRAVAEKGTSDLFAGDETDAILRVESLLKDAVRLRLLSDVPIGVFLSGGIDSSTIAALMQDASAHPIRTFSIGYRETKFNEADHAAAVARHLGTEHTQFHVTPEDAFKVIPELPRLYDEPFSDPSQIPTFLVSKLARSHVTVSLTGDGGDELFGGYVRHIWGRKILKRMQYFPPNTRKLISSVLTTVSPDRWDAILRAIRPLVPAMFNQEMPGERIHKLSEILSAESGEDMYRLLTSHWKNTEHVVIHSSEPPTVLTEKTHWPKLPDLTSSMLFWDMISYLPDDILVKVDRASMSVNLEVRPPFLDHRLVEFAWRLPLSLKLRDGEGKWILRQVLFKYVPKNLVERPKMGFGVPIDSWLRGPLREWAGDLLSESRLRREGFFDTESVRKKWTEHLSGRYNWQYHIWDVLMFQAWLGAQ